jgi:two-component system chemotaxis response regulator CheB
MTPLSKVNQTRALVLGATSAPTHVVRVLEAEGDIVVVGHAAGGPETVRLALDLRPDIVIVELHDADGGGLPAIEQIMARVPTPILVLSRREDGNRSPAVDALAAGALEELPRSGGWTPTLETQLRRRVRMLRKVPVMRHPMAVRRRGADALEHRHSTGGERRVVAIAASTGGPSVLATVLAGLGGLSAPVLVVQHMHPDFIAGLTEWMLRVSALPVELARDGAVARPGHVYIAPGGVHLRVTRDLHLELDPAPETIHRPSADELFVSVAEHAGTGATGVLLTGMGEDGAKGLLAIAQSGGRTLAQDEASCAVFGMPGAARRLGAVTEMLAPAGLARAILHTGRSIRR